jgi:hypothetical protein
MLSHARPFLRLTARVVGLALILGSAATLGAPADGPEFSAEVITRDASGTVRGAPAKLYVGHGAVRIETPEAPAGYFLVDSSAGTALFVRPARRIFTDARQSTRLTQLFVPVDPDAPCGQWQAAAVAADLPGASGDWRCERIEAAADGGSIQYRVLAPEQQPSERWIDPGLRFPVKLRAADGTTLALEHIRIGPQPPEIFTVPPGYQRLDPEALIERIRHSDVWVTPSR